MVQKSINNAYNIIDITKELIWLERMIIQKNILLNIPE